MKEATREERAKRVYVSGSWDYPNLPDVADYLTALNGVNPDFELVSGGSPGVEWKAEYWAKGNNHPIKLFRVGDEALEDSEGNPVSYKKRAVTRTFKAVHYVRGDPNGFAVIFDYNSSPEAQFAAEACKHLGVPYEVFIPTKKEMEANGKKRAMTSEEMKANGRLRIMDSFAVDEGAGRMLSEAHIVEDMKPEYTPEQTIYLLRVMVKDGDLKREVMPTLSGHEEVFYLPATKVGEVLPTGRKEEKPGVHEQLSASFEAAWQRYMDEKDMWEWNSDNSMVRSWKYLKKTKLWVSNTYLFPGGVCDCKAQENNPFHLCKHGIGRLVRIMAAKAKAEEGTKEYESVERGILEAGYERSKESMGRV